MRAALARAVHPDGCIDPSAVRRVPYPRFFPLLYRPFARLACCSSNFSPYSSACVRRIIPTYLRSASPRVLTPVQTRGTGRRTAPPRHRGWKKCRISLAPRRHDDDDYDDVGFRCASCAPLSPRRRGNSRTRGRKRRGGEEKEGAREEGSSRTQKVR